MFRKHRFKVRYSSVSVLPILGNEESADYNNDDITTDKTIKIYREKKEI